jgi:hypothetical protein
MKISGDVFKVEVSFPFFSIHLQPLREDIWHRNDKAVDETMKAPRVPSAKRKARSCLL